MEVVHVHQSLGSFTEGLSGPYSGQSTILVEQCGHTIPHLGGQTLCAGFPWWGKYSGSSRSIFTKLIFIVGSITEEHFK